MVPDHLACNLCSCRSVSRKTTSLAQYARTGSPDLTIRSFDYCNSFWGLADGGVDVLFARMRGAARTMEELRNFWKERCVVVYLVIDTMLTATSQGAHRGGLREEACQALQIDRWS